MSVLTEDAANPLSLSARRFSKVKTSELFVRVVESDAGDKLAGKPPGSESDL